MLQYLKLNGVGPAPEMEIKFAPRLNVITGDNGLGKSFLLDIAWWMLTNTSAHPGIPIRTYPDINDKPSVKFSFNGKENFSWIQHPYGSWNLSAMAENKALVIYAKVDGGFGVWDPLRNGFNLLGNLDPTKLQPSFLFTYTGVLDGLKANGKALCNGLIDDWSGWQKESGESFHRLCRVLKTLSPSDDEILMPGNLTRISLDDVRDTPSLRMPYGQEVPILLASAAIKRILSLAYLLVWTWQEHHKAAEFLGLPEPKDVSIVFLIDEVECHLHPLWQRRIFRALLEVMKALSESDGVKVQIIATTHSPLILASLEPLFDDKQDTLFDLDLVRGENGQTPHVEIHKLPWRKRGEAGNWLTSEAFGLKSSRSLEAETLLEKANEAMNSPNFGAEEAKKLDTELRQLLGDTDPFWMRWRFVGEKKGWFK
jgi:hypothetical protein